MKKTKGWMYFNKNNLYKCFQVQILIKKEKKRKNYGILGIILLFFE